MGPITWVFARVPNRKSKSTIINSTKNNWVGPAPLRVNTENLDTSMLGIAFGYNWHVSATSKAQFTPPRNPITYKA